MLAFSFMLGDILVYVLSIHLFFIGLSVLYLERVRKRNLLALFRSNPKEVQVMFCFHLSQIEIYVSIPALFHFCFLR